MKNLLLIPALGVTLFLIVVACGGGGSEKVVTGRVVEVIARNIAEIESLTIRDAESQTWEFTTTGPVGVSASHLRQHQATGEKVQVIYSTIGGQFVAFDIQDFVMADGETP